jgi:hypothetical protein
VSGLVGRDGEDFDSPSPHGRGLGLGEEDSRRGIASRILGAWVVVLEELRLDSVDEEVVTSRYQVAVSTPRAKRKVFVVDWLVNPVADKICPRIVPSQITEGGPGNKVGVPKACCAVEGAVGLNGSAAVVLGVLLLPPVGHMSTCPGIHWDEMRLLNGPAVPGEVRYPKQ